jgi:hypothetical protein
MPDGTRPKCKLTGEDGNIFAIMGRVSRVLKRAGLEDKAIEMQKRITNAESYGEALIIVGEYVEIE